ncbi:MAG: hypothetical protein M3Y82_02765, partial [Verrucomicrobiota bacterium]|nr:hypothetical protein [Verrucomicrobiota bacterium]
MVFASTADNLLIATNGKPMFASFPVRFNTFLRDRSNATTTLVSANLSGTSGGNGDSIPTDLSTNGQFILFESSADDLVINDTNSFSDIFVRDLQTGSNILVSVSTNSGNANGASRGSVMTPNGRYVAFVSAASNLVSGDLNGIPDVFIRDLQTSATSLVSVGANSINSSSSSDTPEMSADGRYVAFYSTAGNLISGVTNLNQIYVRDVVNNITHWASSNAATALFSISGNSNAVCNNHVLSSDGKFVAFTASNTTTQTNGLLLRYNIATGFTDIVHTNAIMSTGNREDLRTLDITADGRFIVFLANTKTNILGGAVSSVVVWDAQTGTSTVASQNVFHDVAIGSFDLPAIDSAGRFVSFISTATDLTATPAVGFHAYVRDLQLNQNTLVDIDTNGVASDLVSFVVPRLSANGQFLAFGSFDSHLAAQNSRRNYHVFLRDLTTNFVELISAAHPDLHSFTPNGASPFSSWSVNGNGRYVAFSSDASNLATNDNNLNRDIFVRDLLSQTNILASADPNGFSAAGMSFEPSISSDGRYVAFTSTATNLFLNDTNKAHDVFVCN